MSSALPSGLAIDDIMIFVGGDADNEHFDAGMPLGWTVIESGNSNTNLGGTAAWKRYNGIETDWQFDTPTNAGQLVWGVIHAFQGGIKTGAAVESFGGFSVSQKTSHTTGNSAGLLGLLLVAFYVIEDNVDVTRLSHAEWTERDNQTTTVGSDGRLILETKLGGGGANAGEYTTGTSEYSTVTTFNMIPDTNRPTIVPVTADAHDFGVDDTPTLEFTGSDANDDDLEYQFQILNTEATVDSYDETNQNTFEAISVGVTNDSVSQSFTGDGKVGNRCELYLRKNGTPSGDMVLKIFAHSGTFGTSSLPTGTPLAISDVIDMATLTTSYVLTSFVFNQAITLVNTTKYCIIIEVSGGDSSNHTEVGVDSTTPTHGGNLALRNRTTKVWSADSGIDAVFFIFGRAIELDKLSVTPDATFTNTTDGADTHPFDQPDKIDYTVQDLNLRDNYPSSNRDTVQQMTATLIIVGQSFTAIGGGLKKASFFLKKTGSPTGNITAVLYAHTGTYGSSSKGTGSVLATSDTIAASSLTGSYVMTEFNFSTVFDLVAGTFYIIAIESLGSSVGNSVDVGLDVSSPSHDGNKCHFISSTWVDQSSLDTIFEVKEDGGLIDGEYWWRARAKDDLGTNQWSDWTTIRSFEITAGGDIAGVINGIASLTGVLTAKGKLAGPSNGIAALTGVLTSRQPILGVINGATTITGILTGKGELLGSSNGIATLQGILKANGILLGPSNGVATVSGILTGKGTLIGVINGISVTAGDLTTAGGPIDGIINGAATVQGILTGRGALVGAINIIPTITGILIADGALIGIINGVATVNGILTAKGSLLGPSNGVATLTGVLTGKGALLGASNGIASLTAIMQAIGDLIGSSDGAAVVDGLMIGKGPLLGTINGLTTISGILIGKGELLGVINALATVQALLTTNDLFGVINGSATVQGILTAKGSLIGVSNGVGSTSGILLGKAPLLGVINGLSTVQGILTGKGSLVGIINALVTVDGDLINQALIGSLNGISTVQGILTAKGSLLASVDGIATIEGVMIKKAHGFGSVFGAATVSATICAIGETGPAPNYVDSGTIGTGIDASCDVPYPATVNLDDILFIVVMDADDDTFTTPTDWNVINNAIGITNLTVSMYWKRADGTETGTETLTSASSNGQLVAGIMHRYSGCVKTGTPYEQYLTSGENQSSTQTPDWIGDALGPNRLAIALLCVEDNTINAFTANSFTEDNRTATAVGSDAEFAAASIDVSGTTKPTACIWGTSQSEYHDVAGFYLKPTEGAKLTVGVISGKATVVGVLTDAAPGNDPILASITGLATITGILTAKGALLGPSNGSATVQGILTAIGNVLGASNGLATVTGLLTAKGLLSGIINGVGSTEGILIGKGLLVGQINGLATIQGILTAKGSLAGISNGIATVTGVLSTDDLIGAINAAATTSGVLTGKGSLVGIINGIASTSGLLTTDQLIGIINGIATTSGTLTAKGKLEGIINALATVQGILIAKGLLQGVSNVVSTTTGVLSAIGQLEGVINGITTLIGTLATNKLIGATTGIATVTGVLTAKGQLQGIINGIASVTGNLTNVPTPIIGIISGIATVTGTLTGRGALIGETLDAGTTLQGLLEQSQELVGIINGISIVTGVLTSTGGTLKGASNSDPIISGTLLGKGQMQGIINALAVVQGVLNTDENSIFGTAQGQATVSGFLGHRKAMQGLSEGIATVIGTLRDHTDLIYGVIGGSVVVNGTLTATGKLQGSIFGRAFVAGIMGDNPEPRPCTYRVTYNENPKFAVTYKTTQYKVDYTYTKYVVTFNCQKITICQD